MLKGAQEAHEAIRPTSVAREPQAVRRSLTPDQYRLYNLIWQRMVACQMADAVFDVATVDIQAAPPSGQPYLLRATNNGVTAIVDARGRIRERLPQFDAGVLRGRWQVMTGSTPYTRYGYLPLLGCLAALAIFAVLTRRRPR